jgi:glycosyltransferase involved in cell wall biosynthesis
LKILFPFVGDSVGGSHHSVIELHRELCKNNISSCILLHQKGPLSLFLDEIGVLYDYLPIQKFAGDKPNIFLVFYNMLINFNTISKYVRNNKISIVHGNDLRINLTWSFSVKFLSASYVWHQRTVMSASILWKFSNILSDHFISISRYVHVSLPKNIKESKKTLVLNPFNVNLFFEKEKSRESLNKLHRISKETILCGYVGRLVGWKNVDFLIYCFAKFVKRTNFDAHLMIVGTGNDEYIASLEQLVYSLGACNIITFSGFSCTPNKDISAFDFMIAPSDVEPFGRTVVEAMIQKTPVIVANGGGHMEIVKHGDTGWLYHHNDVEGFIMQIKEVVKKNEIVAAVVKKAHDYACSKYSSLGHFENIVNIYKKLN